ncbi:M24 family metallopeptidase [Oryzibacter oryziterrae]|uniref:M24 family metallopeptidase n=1 Tax=Oryzibacter oryziterrae TaxID=2766474 RepID=UPI001F2EF5E5|nr:Xaa-Pro peptidase family protein [Oryzibacter oryziterrae]
MATHFSPAEFSRRKSEALAAMAKGKFDAMLLFAQESMYWLSGYDSFGFCFFQCLVLTSDGRMALLTRSADLRQAQHTSILDDIRIWVDSANAGPAHQLRDLLADLGLAGKRLGVEYDTHGLTARNGKALEAALDGWAQLEDASTLIPALRVVKSAEEIACVREAARIADVAYEDALKIIGPGADEGDILAVLQGRMFAEGGDYPANEFIIGSGADALLCRYKSGRRKLDARDQLTLEFAGVSRHYHAALMRTVVVGPPNDRHVQLHRAALQALTAIEGAMRPGRSFGDVFAAHAEAMDEAGLREHRLNACGYSLGARFTPSWMEWPMFYAGNPALVAPGMTLFAHMIIMDSASGTAMCVGRTYLTTDGSPEPLSSLPLDLPVVP